MTAGTGHRRAAEAIAEALAPRAPGVTVRCVDLLDSCPPWLRRGYPQSYEWLVRHVPAWWAAGYHGCDHPWLFRIVQPARRCWNRVMADAFLRALRHEPPDVIVATHFFPADALASAKREGWLKARLVTVITDLFPHRFWLAREADAVAVGSLQTKALCVERGIDDRRIHVTGIPIGARFAQPVARDEAMRRTGLDPARRTVLIASGGMGVGPIAEIVDGLVRRGRPGLQLVVVCGQNAALAQQLTARPAGAVPVQVLGFVQTMPELMRAADVLITKPGGLTVTEALASGLPMVLCGTIPGQERFNAEFVLEHGAAINAPKPEEAVARALELLDHPDRLTEMRCRAQAVGRPRAAEDVVEQLILPASSAS